MAEKVEEVINLISGSIPSYDETVAYVNKYVGTLKDATYDDLVNEISQGKITPLTVSVALTTIGTLLILGKLLGKKDGSKSLKKKKPRKKLTKAQKANRDIQLVLDHVEKEYVAEIDSYIENPKQFLEQDREYRYKYFEEMLLKELMKLDGIDVADNDVLRDNRKKVIRFIQDHQKRLDKVKKELKF